MGAAWLLAVVGVGLAGAQGGRFSGGPPREAFDACKDLAAEERCSFSTPVGTMSGACVRLPDGLCCTPDGMDRPPADAEHAPRMEPRESAPEEPPREAERAAPSGPPVAGRFAAPPSETRGSPSLGAFALGAAVFGLGMFAARRHASAPTATEPLAPATPPAAAPTAPATAPRASGPSGGRLLARHFELGREIGRGGMGVVYEARDLSLDRRVAVKQMSAEIAHDPRGRERFMAEARIVAKLSHPGIVAIHSILEEPDGLFLVFEYVEGETVSALLARCERLAPGTAFPLLARAAEAVDYAHGQRVIHRDLKPGNIMVDRSGRPKVMDFGIAHQAKMTVSRLTRTQAVGTMAYMPPEQELGEAVRESDVFAFAALTYEALTGELPFPGPNFYQQKVSCFFKRPSALGLPRPSDGVFERAFEPDPKGRFPTAGEFMSRLSEAS